MNTERGSVYRGGEERELSFLSASLYNTLLVLTAQVLSACAHYSHLDTLLVFNTLYIELFCHADTVLLQVENIADPSAQPINPNCQLKNTFVGTNDSPKHSHFLFSNYPDHSRFQA